MIGYSQENRLIVTLLSPGWFRSIARKAYPCSSPLSPDWRLSPMSPDVRIRYVLAMGFSYSRDHKELD